MKQYFIGDKEITEAEAKEIEAKNRKVLRNGTIEELLKIQFVIAGAAVLYMMKMTIKFVGALETERPIFISEWLANAGNAL